MRSSDPLGELAAMARAAAESGVDWRGVLHARWVPELLAHRGEAALRRAIADAGGRPPELGESMADAVEAEVVTMMAEAGYD